MNCDECQEQVFELIEREAVDPEGVREVLARCPQCRASFEAMKAALAGVEALPIEDPPAELDAVIVQRARARSVEMLPLRRNWLRAPQWAVAAAALLAIGVGVWSIPEGEEVVLDDAASGRGEPGAKVGLAELADEAAEKEDAPAEVRALAETERAKRKATRDVGAPAKGESADRAPADPGTRQVVASGASADMAALEADEAPAAQDQEAMSVECQRRISAFEALNQEHEVGAAALLRAEDALALGRCYQEVGNVEEARRWFEVAASHRKTKRRAERALKELPTE